MTRRVPGALLVGALVALAIISSVSSYVFRRNQVQDDRRELAMIAAQTLSSVMQQTQAGLRGAGAIVTRDGELNEDAFRTFGRGLQVQPGLGALALEAVVPGDERRAFERAHGFPILDRASAGTFVPAPARDRYFPVIAVSPRTSITKSTFGFDVGNDPDRGPVARAALDTGTPKMSPFVGLSTTGQPGVVVIAPLYRPGEPVETVEDRAGAAVGLVTAVYTASDLITLVEQRLPPGTMLNVQDGRRVVEGTTPPGEGGASQPFEVGGRRWVVTVDSGRTPGLSIPIGLLVAGVGLAALVQMAITMARRRELALKTARLRLEAQARRTEALQALSGALLEAKAVSAVGEALLETSSRAVDARTGVVALTRDDRRGFDLAAMRGVPADVPRMSVTLPSDARLPLTDAAVSGTEVLLPTYDTAAARYPVIAEALRAGGIGALAAVPLCTDGPSVGALSLGFDTATPFEDDDRDLLLELAERGARAVERIRLYDAAQAARRQAEDERERGESQRMLSVQLSRAGTAEAAADIVLRRAIAIASAVAGGLSLARDDGYLEFVAVRGMADGDASTMPRLAFDDRAASTDAFRTGQEVLAPTSEQFLQRYPDGYKITGAPGRGIWAMPLVAQGTAIGALVLVIDSSRIPTEDDRSAVRALAAQAAQALRRARASDLAREAAEHLQRAMLPAELPTPTGVAVRGLYRAAAAHLEVGGDWYDAVERADGRIMLAVGDVVGRGLEAASTMGQLRVAWRALAADAEGPGELLRSLDRFSRGLAGAEVTTVACAEVRRRERRVRYACAGHLPPLVLGSEGRARFLQGGRSAPLAIADDEHRPEGTEDLRPGDTLILFTDGLVERRDEPLDDGLERLRSVTERLGGSRESLGEGLAGELIGEEGSADDVAILTLTLVPAFERFVPAEPSELADARASMRDWLRSSQVPAALVEDVVLAGGEALANSIEHGRGEAPIHLSGWVDGGRVFLRVEDEGEWGTSIPDDSRGHGLTIMRALMDDVSVESDERGTKVEMVLTLPPPTDSVAVGNGHRDAALEDQGAQ
jgi:serine/threonine-protein kinase RsbW